MNKHLSRIILCLCTLLLLGASFPHCTQAGTQGKRLPSCTQEGNEGSSQPRPPSSSIRAISNRAYFPAVHTALQHAHKSIVMVMYLISFNNNRASHTATLVNDLVDAHKRGVQVTVILDQNYEYIQTATTGTPPNKNKRAYDYLKQNGINVVYDDQRIYTHAKCIIIDSSTVILGSANWSDAAFDRNNEMSLLVESPDIATALIKDAQQIVLDETSRTGTASHTASRTVQPASRTQNNTCTLPNVTTARTNDTPRTSDEEYLCLNTDLLKNGLCTCVSSRSISAWNIYFYCIQHYTPNTQITLTYDEVMRYVYNRQGTVLGNAAKRDYVREALKSLARNNLLTYCNSEKVSDNPIVILAPWYDPKKTSFNIPKTFFAYGWNTRLSLTAQYCYFIGLAHADPATQSWSESITATVCPTYKISRKAYSHGFAELRHWNLVKIEYTEKRGGKNVGPSTYQMMPLYGMDMYERSKQHCIATYGEKRYETAHTYAAIIFCENDVSSIERIIQMIQQYGDAPVKEAFDYVSGTAHNSSCRSIGYITRILQKHAIGYR